MQMNLIGQELWQKVDHEGEMASQLLTVMS